ncbi:MAG: glycyl-radical enzyme activating protein [Firmicutes bacterium]|nr:glycyl-radical enzyme activating protein [Bacillota bacterium]
MENSRTSDRDRGLVFNLQRFSLHDGNGIRTIVFMKGCPLHCLWCSNPESQNRCEELSIKTMRCIRCGTCEAVCRQQAIRLTGDTATVDRSRCIACGTCVEHCNAGALSMLGQWMTVDEVFEQVIADKAFYESSQGGVTFSGGEPLMQAAFLKQALLRFREAGISTVVETCGYASREDLESIRSLTDTFFYDVKLIDAEAHKRFTGVTNELILSNLAYLQESGSEILVRMPLIPGVNDSEENLAATGRFLKETGLPEIQLLPYHSYGASKYPTIGRSYTFQSHSPSAEEMERAKAMIAGYGVKVKI